MTTLAVFIAAAVAEIVGCFAFWAVLRLKASPCGSPPACWH